jgi:hypothetical protein
MISPVRVERLARNGCHAPAVGSQDTFRSKGWRDAGECRETACASRAIVTVMVVANAAAVHFCAA